ncbi:MAG: class I SAM-dependent RNA methyltransferase [Alphaproteobacteria bacterium]
MRYQRKQKIQLPDITKVTIESIAKNGDGYSRINGQNWFIPYCQTGDVILAKPYKQAQGNIYATAEDFIEKVPNNSAPICPYFTQCGGCKLQHLPTPDYQQWKTQQLTNILEQNHIHEYKLDETCFLPPHSRRRVTFRLNSDYQLCFNAHNSHELVAITNCPILEPKLNDILADLQSWLSHYGSFLGKQTELHLTLLNQIELTIITPKTIHPHLVTPLTELKNIAHLGRLCWQQNEHTDIIWQKTNLYVDWANIQIEVAPAPFLQASAQGEQFLQRKLLEYTGKNKQAIELFCGMGTFSFPLLTQCKKIMAYDNAPSAIRAATHAFNHLGQYQGRLQFIERDLFRQPLLPAELNKADIIILDPPRAGAEETVKQIARANIQKIVMVSCNPKTFTRDINILSQAGLKLNRISLLDQFVYSPHMEVIGEIIRK